MSDKLRALIVETHVEIHRHSQSGDDIRISCQCAIGHDHNYADWVELIGGDRYKLSQPSQRRDS